MDVRIVDTVVALNSIGEPVDAIPMREWVVGETDTTGRRAGPVDAVQTLSGAPARYVETKTAQNSIGEWVDTIPVRTNPMLDMTKKRLGVRAVDATDLSGFETWLGAPVDNILVFTDHTTWANVLTKATNEGGAVSGLGRDLSWAVPLATADMTLAQVAAGNADVYINQLIDIILALTPGNGPIATRLGWEANLPGNYYWDAIGHEEDFVAAYQHVATLLRARSPRFKFDWCINYGRAVDPTTFYPGDAYVDIIGMDCYMDTEFDQSSGQTGAQAWAYKLVAPHGLNWLVAFGQERGKPIGMTEWGVNNDVPDYIQLAAAWVRDHNVYYHHYWNSNSAKQDRLSDGQYPNAGARFIVEFGPISITSSNTMSGVVGNAIVKGLTASKAVTWSITSDPSGLFQISGSSLTLPASAAIGEYSVTIRARDERGQTATQTITATVQETATPWTPAAAFTTSLIDLWDASVLSSITKDGSNNVAQINSQVGSPGVRNLAQGSAGSKPVYNATARNSLPGIVFDGSNDYLTQSTVTGVPGNQQAISILLACSGDAALATFKYLLSLGDSTGHAIQIGSGSSQNVRAQDTGSVTSGPTLLGNDRSIVLSIPTGASPTFSLSVDGNTVVTGTVTRAAIDPITRIVVGGECTAASGVGNYFKGVFKEAAIINRALTADEISQAHGYLAWKWGTVANLPSGHPYKLTAPTL